MLPYAGPIAWPVFLSIREINQTLSRTRRYSRLLRHIIRYACGLEIVTSVPVSRSIYKTVIRSIPINRAFTC